MMKKYRDDFIQACWLLFLLTFIFRMLRITILSVLLLIDTPFSLVLFRETAFSGVFSLTWMHGANTWTLKSPNKEQPSRHIHSD